MEGSLEFRRLLEMAIACDDRLAVARSLTVKDDGVWTLRCQRCGESFGLALAAGELIMDLSRTAVCPHCHRKPDEVVSAEALRAWHHVIDFQPSPGRQRPH